MSRSTPFRFSLLLLASIVSGQAAAAAGRVDFATGGATISHANGQQQPLAKGVELSNGDTIRTDAGGRAQIRFPDGAYVSLQPNTEFSVKEYNFDGQAGVRVAYPPRDGLRFLLRGAGAVVQRHDLERVERRPLQAAQQRVLSRIGRNGDVLWSILVLARWCERYLRS